MRRIKLSDVKTAIQQVQATHACVSCAAHLEAIKEHQRKGHKD